MLSFGYGVRLYMKRLCSRHCALNSNLPVKVKALFVVALAATHSPALEADYRLISEQMGGGGVNFLDMFIGVCIFIFLMGWWSLSVIAGTGKFLTYAAVVGGAGMFLLEFSPNTFGQTLGWIFVTATVAVTFLRYSLPKNRS